MANETNNQIKNTDIAFVKVENLFLDPENPRLAKAEKNLSDEELLKILYIRYDLKDVLLSLAQHGYFSEEPLIGVLRSRGDGSKEDTYIIVEGNRRLSALKILLFKEFRVSVRAKNIPVVSKETKKKLDPVPVKIYPSRKEIVPYLGVRHITGVKPWDSYAKAKYAYYLVESGISINQAVKMVSSRSDLVKRGLLTLYVLNEVNKLSDIPWEEEAKGFNFSFLYTALGYRSIRDNIGLTPEIFKDPKSDPIPKKNKSNLLSLMVDIYGAPDSSIPAKIYESRELRKLAAIYEVKEALEAFRSGIPLEQAFRRSGGEKARLEELTRNASFMLDEATAIASHYKTGTGARKWAERCRESAERLVQILED